MKPIIIGKMLESFLKSYNEGACDNLNTLELSELLDELSTLYSRISKMLEKTYTIEEASIYLNVTRLSIYNYTKLGKLNPIKLKGGVLLFKHRELDALKYKNK